MGETVLITGGAGFIGCHLANRLLQEGYRVRVLDNLDEQVHGKNGWPAHLPDQVERVHGDVRDFERIRDALQGVDAVFHLAAAVGVGQSMYQINHYTDVNNRGTAVLLECLAQQPVKKLVVASSMSVYGEGLYRDRHDRLHTPTGRSNASLRAGSWELLHEGQALQPVPTPETKTISPSSVYALSKYDQERMSLMIGEAYNMPTTALRFFNIYGPWQSLSNPYTGVLAIFASRYLNGRPPVIFEDGRQRRDFVSVHDISRACVSALESDKATGEVINIGSGRDYTVYEIALKVGEIMGCAEMQPQITGNYRTGDIRHCFADIDKAAAVLDYQPQIDLADGLAELGAWLKEQAAEDRLDVMREELSSRGLSI